jgi:hypothetical protein
MFWLQENQKTTSELWVRTMSNKGMISLLEILIIIAIAGILGAIAIPTIQRSIDPNIELEDIKAKKTECVALKKNFDAVKPVVVSDNMSVHITACKAVGAW